MASTTATSLASRPTANNTTTASVRHLDQTDLSRRWKISPRTLERWRWLKQGPAYIKVGGRVIYTIEDIEAFEAARRHRFSIGNSAA